ncbi:MAG: thiamine pyrophosphate-dependent dehydrogenase E1 component subunit alpha [Caldilineaceae bacterium]|nr:thiamine pyrophosphate-dependent dehydrogenase E1 component subunit alpha [Caldilineaceae bacterium]
MDTNGHSPSRIVDKASADLTRDQLLELYYWMALTRTFDERMLAYWKQGRGVGGTYSQRGHEAISVGAGYALGPDDIVAPMHRDLGTYLLRGLTPRRIFASLLGKETSVNRGRDSNLHGLGDLDLGIVGFISHLPLSLPVTVGVAMSFKLRKEARVALTFTGDGSSSAGVWYESLNLAALYNAPVVVVVENNQYAYSTPVAAQTRAEHIADRAIGFGMLGVIVDGNDVETVYAVVKEAVDRARAGGGPTLIEAKTMRMRGHAIHDGAEYVPADLLAAWEARDPVAQFQDRLLHDGVADETELDEIRQRTQIEVEDAIQYAEQSPLPDPNTITDGIYAP